MVLKNARAWLMLLLSLGLVLPSASGAPAGDAPRGEGARSEWNQGGFGTDMELKGSGTSYSNGAFTVPLPANASVLMASVDLEGRYTKGSEVKASFDYTQTEAGHKAFKGLVADFTPGNTAPRKLASGEFSSDEYDAVMSSDDDWALFPGETWSQNDGYQLFKVAVPVDDTTSITVTWEGHGGDPWSSWQADFVVYLWNNLSGLWHSVGGAKSNVDATYAHEFSAQGFVDDRTLWILAICTDGNYIYTDYINVTLTGIPYLWPKNPSMDIGGNGVVEWSAAEARFDYNVSLGEALLVSELTSAASGASKQLANVSVLFKSESPGKIRIKNFKVTYVAPPWCKGIPTVAMDEDSTAERLIDLNAYFVDDQDTGRLVYEVSYEQDPKKLKAELNDDNHTLDFRTVTRNFWGILKFRVRATDTDGLSTESASFQVRVDAVNDPPVIQTVGELKALEEEGFSYQLKVRDVDADLDPNETARFEDDTKLFDIDPALGWLNFTPVQSQVGRYTVNVTVTDRAGGTDIETFNLTVEDVNDPPAMDPVPDQTAREDMRLNLAVRATDPDIPFGDSLTFTDDCPVFDIDPATGQVSFVPTIADVGVYRVNLTVRDSRGESDRKTFMLTVLNADGTLNRPPVIDPLPNLTAVEGEPFVFQVNASDPDPDDTLTFHDNTQMFTIGVSNGTISFVPLPSQVGTFKIIITVKDYEELSASATLKLTISKRNNPPNITLVKPTEGSRVVVKKEVLFSVDVTDPDNDRLNITWKEGENVLGTGAQFTHGFLQTGGYIITLVVSDGKNVLTRELNIEVVDKPAEKKSAGFELVALAVSLALAVGVGASRRRR